MLLVTGGAGFIGSNVVASFNEAGHTDVVVSDILGKDGKWRNLQKRQLADFIPPADLMRWLSGRHLVHDFDDVLDFLLLGLVLLLVVFALGKERQRRREHHEDENREHAAPLFHKA